MGVEFFPCDVCEDTICDAGDFYRCYDCHRAFCSDSCMKEANVSWEHCDDCKNADEADLHDCYVRVCGYCKKEIVTNDELLVYALEQLSVSREELARKYLERGI